MNYTLEKNGFVEFEGTDVKNLINEAQKHCNEYWVVGDDIQAMEYELVSYNDHECENEVSRVDISLFPDWHDEPSDFEEHNILNKAMTGVK